MIPLSITPKSGGVTKLFPSLEAAARACEPALQIQVGRMLRLSPLFAGRRLSAGWRGARRCGASAYGLGTAAKRRSLIRGVATRLPPLSRCLSMGTGSAPPPPLYFWLSRSIAPPGLRGACGVAGSLLENSEEVAEFVLQILRSGERGKNHCFQGDAPVAAKAAERLAEEIAVEAHFFG